MDITKRHRVDVRICWNKVDLYVKKGSLCQYEILYTYHELISYEFHNSNTKENLAYLLLDINFNPKPSIGGYGKLDNWLVDDMALDILELLASIVITKDSELEKAAEEYLNGAIDMETLGYEVVAYCVAEKLSE